MTPALFTRETLWRIKREAPTIPAPDIAQQLGWDLERLRRTARAHGIELINPTPTIKPATYTPPQRYPKRPATVPRTAIDASMTYEEVRDQLMPRQALIFTILMHKTGDHFIPSDELSQACPDKPKRECIVQTVRSLNMRLMPTRWRVESFKGRGGGYRLVRDE